MPTLTPRRSAPPVAPQPNPDDPLVPDIAKEYKTNRAVYTKKATEHTHKQAGRMRAPPPICSAAARARKRPGVVLTPAAPTPPVCLHCCTGMRCDAGTTAGGSFWQGCVLRAVGGVR